MLPVWLKRVSAGLRRCRDDRDLDDEIRHHLDLLAADYERRGLSKAEAHLAARRSFGGIEQMKETYRDRRGLAWVDDLRLDARHAWRGLARNPGFALVAIVTLSLGIGANTAAFSLFNALRFKMLPVEAPRDIVQILSMTDGTWDGVGRDEYLAYQSAPRTLSGIVAYAHAYMADADEAREVDTYLVSGNFFDVLGVHPTHGRFFLSAEDESPGKDPVVVLAADYWRRRFGGSPDAIGRSLTLNGRAFTIVGVAPDAFRAPTYGDPVADIWIPWMMLDVAKHAQATPFTMLGRLRQGATVAAAQAEFDVLATTTTLPAAAPGRRTFRVAPAAGRPMDIPRDEPIGMSMAHRILLVGVSMLLVVACANLAGLLLARGMSRAREIAARRALGASASRLFRQLVTESLVLALAGAVPGVVCALLFTRVIAGYYGAETEGTVEFLDVRMDPLVIAYATLVATLAGVAIGAWPALQAVRTPIAVGRFAPRRPRVTAVLLVGQVALSLALIVLAGLLSRTISSVRTAPGFDAAHVAFLRAKTNIARFDDRQSRQYFREVTQRLAAVPGVESVALATYPPLNTWAVEEPFSSGAAGGEHAIVRWNRVSPTFFETLAIPIVEGRAFGVADAAPEYRSLIVNEAFAKRFWPEGNAVGQTVFYREQTLTVIGVVRYSNYAKTDGSGRLFAFFPGLVPGNRLFVRTTGDPAALLPLLHRAITAVDPSVPVSEETTLQDLVDNSFRPVGLAAVALGYSAALGLILSAVSLYGVLAYDVGRRSKEIGIRVALGARSADVARLVSWESATCLFAGIGLGLAGAFGSTRLIRSLLYGVSLTDATTFTAAPIAIAVVGVVAIALPIRHALRVDPAATLRAE